MLCCPWRIDTRRQVPSLDVPVSRSLLKITPTRTRAGGRAAVSEPTDPVHLRGRLRSRDTWRAKESESNRGNATVLLASGGRLSWEAGHRLRLRAPQAPRHAYLMWSD